jgi:hypothetical protein
MATNLIVDSEFLTYYRYYSHAIPNYSKYWFGGNGIGVGQGYGGSTAIIGPKDGSAFAQDLGVCPAGPFVRPGEVYTGSVYLNMTDATAGTMTLEFRDDYNHLIAPASAAVTFGNAARVSTTITVPYGVIQLHLLAYVTHGSSVVCPAGKFVAISQPQIEVGPSFTGYSPSPGQVIGGWSPQVIAAKSWTTGAFA